MWCKDGRATRNIPHLPLKLFIHRKLKKVGKAKALWKAVYVEPAKRNRISCKYIFLTWEIENDIIVIASLCKPSCVSALSSLSRRLYDKWIDGLWCHRKLHCHPSFVNTSHELIVVIIIIIIIINYFRLHCNFGDKHKIIAPADMKNWRKGNVKGSICTVTRD